MLHGAQFYCDDVGKVHRAIRPLTEPSLLVNMSSLTSFQMIEDRNVTRYVRIQSWLSIVLQCFTLVLSALTYSSYALLLWDYLLTLDDEVGQLHLPCVTLLTLSSQVTYIWKSPCSVVKCLFMGNRYLNLIMLPVVVAQTAGVLPLDSNAVRHYVTPGSSRWV